MEIFDEIAEPFGSLGGLVDLLLGTFGFLGLSLFLGQLLLLEGVLALLFGLSNLGTSSLASGLGLFQSADDLLGAFVGSQEFLATEGLDVRVQLDHDAKVDERILLAVATSGESAFSGVQARLDFARVDDAVKVRVGHQWAGKAVRKFKRGLLAVGSVELVEFLESGLGPDNESAKMTTRSQKENVQAVDAEKINSGKIAESMGDRGLLVVDDQWSLSLNITPVTALSLSSADDLAILDFLNISICLESLQKFDGLRGFLEVHDGVVADNEGNFGNLLDAMSAGKNKRG